MGLRALKEEDAEPCQLCNLNAVDECKYGSLYKYKGIVVHYYCLIFSEPLEQNGEDKNGILGFLKEDILDCLKAVREKICCYCSKPKASIKCSKGSCPAIFHYPCGIQNGTMHQFMGRFHSFCITHRPKQKIQPMVLTEAEQSQPVCLICLDVVDYESVTDVIYANCCRYTWYHRECLQKMALSAGYLFKCVKCSDKKKFLWYVKRYGIYVPQQDASWELERGAYQDLYWQYENCDAVDCKCPFGRTYNKKAWRVVRCSSCGSKGIHTPCGKLGKLRPLWECEPCRNMTSELPFNLNPSNYFQNRCLGRQREASTGSYSISLFEDPF